MDIDNYWDDVVNNGDEGLDSILTILDFPMESLEGDDCFIADWDASNSSHYLGPIPPDVLVDTGPPVLPPPIDAIQELKQSSPYLPDDACRSLIMLPNKSIEAQEPQGVFQIQSPISVLQTKSPVVKSCPSKRNRSKRASPSGPNPWLSISTAAGKARKNRERRKLLQLSVEGSSDTKRCAHCQVTKTPQWREGPTGPKTLCNACGVRYRSGRLFPEYRPAASPTFVASLHSNSHRKVVEMRTKAIRQSGTKVEQPSMSPEMEFVPMSSHLFDDLM